jgi:inhibitor of cysteine peptidase
VFYIESNPSTGYTWQMAPGIDESVVKLSSQELIQPPQTTTPPIVGAPGQQKFTFTAVAKGQTIITLNYARPGEKDVPPAKTQIINATVLPTGTSIKIESSIPPSSLQIYTGDQFVFYIESNPSTGYTWQMASGIDESVVKLSSQELIQPPQTTTPPIVGAPGQQKFTFTAVAKGQTIITLNYARPWEKDVPPAKTQVINATVK